MRRPLQHMLYTFAVAAANKTIADQQEQARPVDGAVKAIVSALTDRNPKTHYRVGRETPLVELLNHLLDPLARLRAQRMAR